MTIWDIYPKPVVWIMMIFAWIIRYWRIIGIGTTLIILFIYIKKKKKREHSKKTK